MWIIVIAFPFSHLILNCTQFCYFLRCFFIFFEVQHMMYYLHFFKQDKRLAKHSNENSWVWSSASIDASLAWQAIVISDDLLSAHEMLLQTLTRMPNYQNLSNQLPIPSGISPFWVSRCQKIDNKIYYHSRKLSRAAFKNAW